MTKPSCSTRPYSSVYLVKTPYHHCFKKKLTSTLAALTARSCQRLVQDEGRQRHQGHPGGRPGCRARRCLRARARHAQVSITLRLPQYQKEKLQM